MEQNFNKIPFLKSTEIDIFHEIMFNFKQETFDSGTLIFKENEISNAMFLIKNGLVEILVSIDGHDLVIERLFRGSIINHRSFLMADIADVSGRCGTAVTLFYLTTETM